MKCIIISVFIISSTCFSVNAQVTMDKCGEGLLFMEKGEEILFYQTEPKNYNGKNAGILILDHPANPGYPQLWILRNKNSMQNAVYPGNKVVPVSTDKPLVLKYSLLIYSGDLRADTIKN